MRPCVQDTDISTFCLCRKCATTDEVTTAGTPLALYLEVVSTYFFGSSTTYTVVHTNRDRPREEKETYILNALGRHSRNGPQNITRSVSACHTSWLSAEYCLHASLRAGESAPVTACGLRSCCHFCSGTMLLQVVPKGTERCGKPADDKERAVKIEDVHTPKVK